MQASVRTGSTNRFQVVTVLENNNYMLWQRYKRAKTELRGAAVTQKDTKTAQLCRTMQEVGVVATPHGVLPRDSH